MGHWNYRVMAFKYAYINDVYFEIREVHYDGNKPTAYSAVTAKPFSDTTDGLAWQIKEMRACLKKPILYGDEGLFPKIYKPKKVLAKKKIKK